MTNFISGVTSLSDEISELQNKIIPLEKEMESILSSTTESL